MGGAPTYGIKHIGAEVIAESEAWLLDVAKANEPNDNLIGLCSRCHHLVHRELLIINPDPQVGIRFTNSRNRPVARQFRQRVASHQVARMRPRTYAPMRA